MPELSEKTAKAIIDGGGDYLLAAKENQPDLYNDVKLFLDAEKAQLYKYEQCEKSHGRLEMRTAWVANDVNWYEKSDAWANLACFGTVRPVGVQPRTSSLKLTRFPKTTLFSLQQNP